MKGTAKAFLLVFEDCYQETFQRRGEKNMSDNIVFSYLPSQNRGVFVGGSLSIAGILWLVLKLLARV